MSPSRFLRAACIFLAGVLAATLLWGHLFFEHAREDAIRYVGEFNAETERMATVYDRQIPEGNSQRVWTEDELREVDWEYFYGISGGLYGAQRN